MATIKDALTKVASDKGYDGPEPVTIAQGFDAVAEALGGDPSDGNVADAVRALGSILGSSDADYPTVTEEVIAIAVANGYTGTRHLTLAQAIDAMAVALGGTKSNGTIAEAIENAGPSIDKPDMPEAFAELVNHIKAGDYKSHYSIGDTFRTPVTGLNVMDFEIVAFDADEKADGSGYAPVTLISKYVFARMSKFADSTSSVWGNGALRQFVYGTMLPMFPKSLQKAMVPVKKYSREKYSSSTTTETLWVPSAHELSSAVKIAETNGPTYDPPFSNDASRAKTTLSVTAQNYWTRSIAGSNGTPFYISTSGTPSMNYSATKELYVVLGFCL